MKEFVKNLIAAVITALVVSLITLNMPATVVTLVSFIGFKYLVDKVVAHVSGKIMPTVYQWIDYVRVLVGEVLLVAGLYYGSKYCLIFAGVAFVVGIVSNAIESHNLKKVEK